MPKPSADLAAELEIIDRRLRELGTPERAEREKAYLKSDLIHYGATVPAVRRVAKEISVENGEALSDLAEALWIAPVHERRMLAVVLLADHEQLLDPDDVPILERFLRESKTWAYVDALAASVIGPMTVRHPELEEVLDRWAVDPDFWMRRSALLAHLLPLRSGGGEFERFSRYADAMLEEKEFFIRKAIGWVLRDLGKKRPELVVGWLAPRTHRASGVTVREAIKHLPPQDHRVLLEAYRERRPAG